MARKVIVLGAGFAGLSAGAYLSRQGFDVEILEKNAIPGGRARRLEAEGFTFDMGPGWYWMPEVFERFFAHFDSHPSNYFDLIRLNPSFRIYSSKNEPIDVPGDAFGLMDLFESIEKGSAKRLKNYLNITQKQYRLAMNGLIYQPGRSVLPYLNPKTFFSLISTKSITSLNNLVKTHFKDARLQNILEFPMMFLGATQSKTPGIFGLASYSNIEYGTWFPKGGMYKVIEAMEKVCFDFGTDITYNVNVDQLEVLLGKVNSAHFLHRNFYGEFFVSSADYFHTDVKLLSDTYQNYTVKNWNKKKLAPSALIFYLGISKKLPELIHHNLFLDNDFLAPEGDISKQLKWPENPAFFVSVPSKSDTSLAPDGCECMIITVPVPCDLIDTGKIREHYFSNVIEKIEKHIGYAFLADIIYQKSYAHTDFINDYNAFKGNAFGLTNRLSQTGPFRPKIYNKKLPNLFYAGQNTVPGPGMPAAIISGEIAAREIYKASGGRKS